MELVEVWLSTWRRVKKLPKFVPDVMDANHQTNQDDSQ
jgi:hypothetical protein